jgi:predicted house-cleaning NTP pyrophosphatase (Maf/HAM1 superfamily)
MLQEMTEIEDKTFETISPDIDEKAIRDPDAHKLTLKIARAKAEALLPQVCNILMICNLFVLGSKKLFINYFRSSYCLE